MPGHERRHAVTRLGRVPPSFVITLRGYDIAQVDELLARADHALSSGNGEVRAAARAALRAANLRRRLRGYARHQVARAVDQRLRELG